MIRRSHFEKSGSWREWNLGGKSSPKNTISGFTRPCKMGCVCWGDGIREGMRGHS